jgi:chromosome segregation ATPase
MLDGDLGENRGIMIGAAIGLGRRMREEEAQHDADIARYQAVIDQLSKQLLDTQIDLAAERCEIAGLRASLSEIRRLDPQAKGFADSGQTYRSGKAKSVAALVYEREYDRKADEFGLPALKGTYNK